MVQTVEEAGVFDGNNIPEVLYHTYRSRIPARIAAYVAGVVVRHVVAYLAKADMGTHPLHRFGKSHRSVFRLLQKVHNEAEGSFFAYARQGGKSLNCILYQPGRVLHEG